MLRWQHKNGRNSPMAVWARFIVISCVLHTVVAVFVLFVYCDRQSHYALTMSSRVPPMATVVLMTTSTTGASSSGVNHTLKTVAIKQPSTRVIKQEKKQGQHKKQPAASKKSAKKKSVAKVLPVKKKLQKTKPKIAQKLKVPEKPIKKEPQEVPKKIEQLVVPPPEKPVLAAVDALMPPDANQDMPHSDTITISYGDARVMHHYTVLHTELSKHWSPPPGIADDCTCQLTACIDRSGAVGEVIVQESSGVLIFDITARAALLAVTWPSWTWGSSITITFKP